MTFSPSWTAKASAHPTANPQLSSRHNARVIRDERFLADIQIQTAWLVSLGRRADALRLKGQVRDRLRQVAEYPELGHDEDGDGLRELSLSPLPFIVLYQLDVGDQQVVRVLRLFHERQDQHISS